MCVKEYVRLCVWCCFLPTDCSYVQLMLKEAARIILGIKSSPKAFDILSLALELTSHIACQFCVSNNHFVSMWSIYIIWCVNVVNYRLEMVSTMLLLSRKLRLVLPWDQELLWPRVPQVFIMNSLVSFGHSLMI